MVPGTSLFYCVKKQSDIRTNRNIVCVLDKHDTIFRERRFGETEWLHCNDDVRIGGDVLKKLTNLFPQKWLIFSVGLHIIFTEAEMLLVRRHVKAVLRVGQGKAHGS
ncbi:MAG: hypothetical protein LUE16_00145 [Lachnospiraceae bacterium]|nr:hypothetical protein [Lachnospiraceae bacterium]